jgi:short subunit fatty acids transporter
MKITVPSWMVGRSKKKKSDSFFAKYNWLILSVLIIGGVGFTLMLDKASSVSAVENDNSVTQKQLDTIAKQTRQEVAAKNNEPAPLLTEEEQLAKIIDMITGMVPWIIGLAVVG